MEKVSSGMCGYVNVLEENIYGIKVYSSSNSQKPSQEADGHSSSQKFPIQYSSPCSQKPHTWPYPEPYAPNMHP